MSESSTDPVALNLNDALALSRRLIRDAERALADEHEKNLRVAITALADVTNKMHVLVTHW